jgi:hypothetical protein
MLNNLLWNPEELLEDSLGVETASSTVLQQSLRTSPSAVLEDSLRTP